MEFNLVNQVEETIPGLSDRVRGRRINTKGRLNGGPPIRPGQALVLEVRFKPCGDVGSKPHGLHSCQESSAEFSVEKLVSAWLLGALVSSRRFHDLPMARARFSATLDLLLLMEVTTSAYKTGQPHE